MPEPEIRLWPFRSLDPIPNPLPDDPDELNKFLAPVWVKSTKPGKPDPKPHGLMQLVVAARAMCDDYPGDKLLGEIADTEPRPTARRPDGHRQCPDVERAVARAALPLREPADERAPAAAELNPRNRRVVLVHADDGVRLATPEPQRDPASFPGPGVSLQVRGRGRGERSGADCGE